MASRVAQVSRYAKPSPCLARADDRLAMLTSRERRDVLDEPSKDDFKSKLRLTATLVTVGRRLSAENTAGRTLEQGLPEGRTLDVGVRITPVQPVGGVVCGDLEFSVNSLSDGNCLSEIRVQVPEFRTGQAIVLQGIGPQHIRIRRDGGERSRVEPVLWRRIGNAGTARDDQVPKLREIAGYESGKPSDLPTSQNRVHRPGGRVQKCLSLSERKLPRAGDVEAVAWLVACLIDEVVLKRLEIVKRAAIQEAVGLRLLPNVYVRDQDVLAFAERLFQGNLLLISQWTGEESRGQVVVERIVHLLVEAVLILRL